MTQLYPLKFKPILKEKIWGGNTLASDYGKKSDGIKNIGERVLIRGFIIMEELMSS